ncbi:NACHT domain-containing protein [Erwinia pyri]|uniref:NACHT domain-containing protein n=1 Tax=Erwinia pyri TaxID=3062598 RepID=A0AA50DKH4_9GAMM|nr:NACHT domain-containing protein [Erwinia sp. DE2]WLS79495.1 NACHT domain-containing protein [Erwinia sp. DE2]
MAANDGDTGTIEKVLGLAERIFNSVWSDNFTHDSWHWIILISLFLIIITIIFIIAFKTLSSVFESSAKLIDSYKSSGLPLWLNKDNKLKVKKRKQFCSVLDADLAYLAKAENWNDQYFTDLEADVETEGGYYASALNKLLKKKSFGLRKEHSLIRAITTSTERAMQLVGEPGSGKSVALRHLAKQFAEQGRKSNDKKAIVPLYINLREIELLNKEDINADSIREFILDNIRRGDADTSAFVKDNWQDYCSRGIWLFLFDSFDEIPAILHAETGSDIIKKYSQALRHFLEGMGECKGILASREFKGPEALPWKKLRILPLTGEKQDELIRNSFLDEKNMSMVRQHLASSHSSIGATPLFLTLLCRYVRDEHQPPNNDHDILFQHIDRLACREPEYLKRKYELSPEELVKGAERLARLFAEDENLSLAPTLDQIRTQLSAEEIPGDSLENLISALVDSKIGRADVPNAKHGDKRFAFAHRRYQEALFVRYLTTHPEIISPRALLTETRWREYTVTLLQTRDYEEFSDLLSHASFILSERAEKNDFIMCEEPPLPSNLIYYNWLNETAKPLLSLLQEGLAHRLQDVPYSLTSAVLNFLKPRWETGDSKDRSEVLCLGGLLPHDILVKYLVETFSHGTKSERLHAFRQAAFTQGLPEQARAAVLKMLSNQVIAAKDRADLLAIEALAARLPQDMGANIVVTRCKRLRRNLGIIKKIVPRFFMIDHFAVFMFMFSSIFNTTSFIPKNLLEKMKVNYQNVKSDFDFSFLFSILLTSWLVVSINLIKYKSTLLYFLFVIDLIMIAILFMMLSPFLVRHLGKKVSVIDLAQWLFYQVMSRKFITQTLLFLFASSIFLGVCIAIGYAFIFFAEDHISNHFKEITRGNPSAYFLIGIFIAFSTFNFFIIVKILIGTRKARSENKRSLSMLNKEKEKGGSEISIAYSADHYEQLIFWLQSDDNLMCDVHAVRVFSSFVLGTLRIENIASRDDGISRPKCLSTKKTKRALKSNEKKDNLKELRQILEDRLLK